ncbi:MAG: Urease accessory protein UreE 1 [Accumulibacter sp.]|uniref:urease accessory protein UreE n=1 Tax=Accumulibacter sp. TaxID=2053492 RepID=UPI00120C2444|nr:urease accessory protein UreE [Accumulibacter sp.]TLD47123.1 MAG: Urease accessory protein UreE 1 [Accumulibacter sp.]
MLFAESFAAADAPVSDHLVLPYDARCRSRQRVRLVGGEEMGYVLPAGTVLRHGDRLLAGDGRVVEVAAAPEELLEVRARDSLQLTRAAYHLGNRHVPVQLGDGFLRLQLDHVLGDMLRRLACSVSEVVAPFDPEGGAYGAAHGHGEAPAHGHDYRPTKGRRVVDAHDPGQGPHRSPAKIHEFK